MSAHANENWLQLKLFWYIIFLAVKIVSHLGNMKEGLFSTSDQEQGGNFLKNLSSACSLEQWLNDRGTLWLFMYWVCEGEGIFDVYELIFVHYPHLELSLKKSPIELVEISQIKILSKFLHYP